MHMEEDYDAPADAEFGKGQWHCDDLADAKAVPDCVLKFLAIARAPAHGLGMTQPPLFATHASGRRVRIVMASRFGDVGITLDLNAERGYFARVLLPELADFSETP